MTDTPTPALTHSKIPPTARTHAEIRDEQAKLAADRSAKRPSIKPIEASPAQPAPALPAAAVPVEAHPSTNAAAIGLAAHKAGIAASGKAVTVDVELLQSLHDQLMSHAVQVAQLIAAAS